jgi:iron complex transport system permease protein
MSNACNCSSLTSVQTFRKTEQNRLVVLLFACLGLSLLAVLDIFIGPSMLEPAKVLNALNPFTEQTDAFIATILFDIRLPMTLMAALVGASLGLAGAQMQTILNNPLASPYTLGLSAAAGFGAALAIILGIEIAGRAWIAVPLFAFLSAGSAAVLVYKVAMHKAMRSETLVLAGIATLFMFQSLQSLLQYKASPEILQQIVFWLFGSLTKATWISVSICAGVFIVAILIIWKDKWALTTIRLGDERARALNVDVSAVRRRIFFAISLLTAGAVAFVGTIGFIGLVAPHIARMLIGEDQRFLIPMSAFMGAVLLIAASIASKILAPGAIVPIGIVTALVGVPFLFYLLLTSRRALW